MDEKFLEQASALEEVRRVDARQAAQRSLQGAGQARCDDCGEPIPKLRRKAAPYAIRCITCQTRFEALKKVQP
jgi:phage/conjugal plasmid C-4 type zinc finger TraR family protein